MSSLMGDRLPDWATDGLAAYRLTRLVVEDTITTDLRDLVISAAYRWDDRDPIKVLKQKSPDNVDEWVEARAKGASGWWKAVAKMDEQPPKLAKLIICRYCVGVWAGFGVVAVRRLLPRLWGPVADGLATAALAALIFNRED